MSCLQQTNIKQTISLISRLRSFTPQTKRNRTSLRLSLPGILTIEAALLLPLFLGGILVFLHFFQIEKADSAICQALTQTGRLLCSAGIEEQGLSRGGIVQATFLTMLKKNGTSGQVFAFPGPVAYTGGSNQEYLRVQVAYQVKQLEMIPLVKHPTRTLAMTFRYWNGNVPPGETEEAYVYVTKNGRCYHTTIDCRHLKLNVRKISGGELAFARNEAGGKYQPCSFCKGDPCKDGCYYITTDGDCYHTRRDCGGIKRTIRRILLKDAGAYLPCKDCGRGGSKP